MRKLLLINSMILASMASLSAQDCPQAQWGNLFGGSKTSGDQSTAVATSSNGDILWLNTANTDSATPDVFYAGEVVFTNSSTVNNLSLICTDPQGALKWEVNTTTTDVASGQGNVAVDNEGNVVFSAKVRQGGDLQMNLVDASGKETHVGNVQEKRYYQIMVAKLDSDGRLLWVKLFDQSTEPAPAASGNTTDFTPDAVSSTALTVDSEGSIYVGGNYCTDMTIDGVTLAPTNVSSWKGDSQTTCGNMFLVKLDKDGKFMSSLIGEGDISGMSTIQNLVWENDQLYLYGYAKGEGSFTFAGVELTPTTVNSPIVGALDASLNSLWLKCLQGEAVDGKSALQNVGLSVYGENLWIAGQYNLKIVDTDNSDNFVSATQGSIREGFVIKFNAQNGAWLGSADSRVDFPEVTKLCGYFKVIQNTDNLGKAYVYGYTMDATQGIFLREYDAQTLEANEEHSWNIATGGGVPSCIAIAYDQKDNSIYITGRGNKAFTLMGDPEITTEATKAWDVLMAKYLMPDFVSTFISSVLTPADFESDTIFDLNGRYITNSEVNLPKGIYVKAGRKFVAR